MQEYGQLVCWIARRNDAGRMVLTRSFKVGRPLRERLRPAVLPVDRNRAFEHISDASELVDMGRDLSERLQGGDARSQGIVAGIDMP